MFEAILIIITLFLALIGLTTLIRQLALMIIGTGKAHKQALIVCLDDYNAEIDLRGAIERTKWMGNTKGTILAVDCGLEEHTLQICRSICVDYGNVLLCKADKLPVVLKNRELWS